MTDQMDQLPLTVLLPETASDPVVAYDHSAALRVAIAERAYVQNLGDEWDQPGNYLLLDPPSVDGSWGVYVGKAAPGGVRARLLSHLRSKDHWSRVVIIQRDTTHGFNSAQVGWLEGRLYDLMDAAAMAQLNNGNRPRDETLPPFDRAMLEASVTPIRRLLRLLGYDPATEDDALNQSVRPSQPRKFYGVKLVDMIAAGMPAVGSVLVSTNAVSPATAQVVADGIEFDGRVYPNPSAAGGAARGRSGSVGTNGWDFWAIETPSGKVSLATLRARYQEAQKTSEATP